MRYTAECLLISIGTGLCVVRLQDQPDGVGKEVATEPPPASEGGDSPAPSKQQQEEMSIHEALVQVGAHSPESVGKTTYASNMSAHQPLDGEWGVGMRLGGWLSATSRANDSCESLSRFTRAIPISGLDTASKY